MAKLNVEVILGLVDRLSGPLRSIRGTLETWSDPLGAVRENLERITALSGNMVLVGAALNRSGTALMSPLQTSAQAAISLESAMADVRKVVDFDSPAAFAAFAAHVERLSRTTPITAEGLAAIAAAGGQLGVGVTDLPAYIDLVSKMSTAFDMMPEVAGDAMAKLSNVYGIPIPAMGSLGDAINHLSNNSAAKASEIVDALSRVGGVAKGFGLTAVQAGALSGAFIALGKSPEVAGTAVNALLLKLQTATKQPEKFGAALASMGIDAAGLEASIGRDAQGALLGFLSTLQQVDETQRAGVLVDLFGLEYSDDVAALVGGFDQYRKSLELTGDATAYAGSMQREFAARSATTQNGLTLLSNRVAELKRTIGDALLPVINALAERFGAIISRVADFLRAHPRLTAALALIVAGFAAAMIVGGGLIVALAGIVGALAVLVLALGPVGLMLSRILAPLRLLPAPLRLFGRVALMAFTGPVGAVALLASGLRNLRGSMFSVITAPARLVTGLRGIVASAATVPGALGKVVFVVRALGTALMANPMGLIIAGIAAGALLVYKYWAPISGFFSGLWSGLVEGLAPIAGAFSSAFGGIMPYIQPVLDGLQWVWDKLTALLAPVADTGGAAEAMGKRWGLAIAGMITKVGELLGGLLALPGKMFQIGSDIVQGLWNGWLSKWESFKAWVSGLGDVIPNWLKSPLKVQSPSRVFAEIGANLVAGLQVGMTQTIPALLKDMGALAGKLAAVPLLAAPLTMAPAQATVERMPAAPVAATARAAVERLPGAAHTQPAERLRTLMADDPASKARDERRLGWLRDARARVAEPAPQRIAAAQAASGRRGAGRGEVSMPISVSITAPSGADPRQLAALVRDEVSKAGREVGRRMAGALYDQPDDM